MHAVNLHLLDLFYLRTVISRWVITPCAGYPVGPVGHHPAQVHHLRDHTHSKKGHRRVAHIQKEVKLWHYMWHLMKIVPTEAHTYPDMPRV